MKREWPLIRAILIRTEEHRGPEGALDASAFYDLHENDAVVRAHIHILQDGGFIKGTRNARVERLTWDGHELLASIQDEGVFRRIMAKAKEAGIGLPVEILKQLAVTYTKNAITGES